MVYLYSISTTHIQRGQIDLTVANAHLIAAAPDLLALVEDFLDCRWSDVGPYEKAGKDHSQGKGQVTDLRQPGTNR